MCIFQDSYQFNPLEGDGSEATGPAVSCGCVPTPSPRARVCSEWETVIAEHGSWE